jgi:hypothetical protein
VIVSCVVSRLPCLVTGVARLVVVKIRGAFVFSALAARAIKAPSVLECFSSNEIGLLGVIGMALLLNARTAATMASVRWRNCILVALVLDYYEKFGRTGS